MLFPFLLFLLFHKFANSQIRISSDLNCSFSARCLWQNDTQSAFVGFNLIGDLTPNKPFPVSDGPEENFFLSTVGPPGFSGQIGLLSEIVECQLGGAKLKFRHFQTGPHSRVEACIRYPPGSPLPSSLHCYGNFPSQIANHKGPQWEMASVELPPMTQPMELIIRASFEWPNSLVGIDDIVYEAILCENSHRGAAKGGGGRIDGANEQPMGGQIHPNQQISPSNGHFPPFSEGIGKIGAIESKIHLEEEKEIWAAGKIKEKEEKNEWEKPKIIEKMEEENLGKTKTKSALNGTLDCDFDESNICAYQNGSSNVRGWVLANKPIGNPLTGIQKDQSGGGWFLYAGALDANADYSPSTLYLLQSKEPIPPSSPSSPISLQFFYNLAGVRGRLRVCFANSTEELAKIDVGLCSFIREGWTELNELSLQIDPREWRKGEIRVPMQTNKIFFLADQLAKNYFVGLDSVKFVEEKELANGRGINFGEY